MKRFALLDFLRTVALVNMVLFGDYQYYNSPGKHGLLIYFVHQPLLLGLFWLMGLL